MIHYQCVDKLLSLSTGCNLSVLRCVAVCCSVQTEWLSWNTCCNRLRCFPGSERAQFQDAARFRTPPGLAAPQMPRAGRIWDRVDLSCLQFFAQARLTDRPDSGAQRVHLTSRFQRLPGSPHSQFSALTRLAGHAVTPGGQDFEAYRFDGRPGPGGAQAR